MPFLDLRGVLPFRNGLGSPQQSLGARSVLHALLTHAAAIAILQICGTVSGMPLHNSASGILLQSAGGAGNGKLFVPEPVMAGQCITMVTPKYPQGSVSTKPESALLILRVFINKSGNAFPMYVVSGPPAFENEAMSAARLWKYKPYKRDGQPVDVVTNVRVTFSPGQAAGIVAHPSH